MLVSVGATATLNTMKHQYKAPRHQYVILNEDAFRLPQTDDKFKIELTTETRQYVVRNLRTNGLYTVTFFKSESGNKLVSCDCPDFAGIRRHDRQCKHIHVAYYYHVAICTAKARADRAARAALPVALATPKPRIYSQDVITHAGGAQTLAGVRIN